jgi:hypothetical protein
MICKSGSIAGVDGQHAAGDVAAAVTQQILHHTRDVVDLRRPAEYLVCRADTTR